MALSFVGPVKLNRDRKRLCVHAFPSPAGWWSSFPLGRAGKDPGKAFLKGFICSCLPLGSCFAPEISEEVGTTFVTACQALIPSEIC